MPPYDDFKDTTHLEEAAARRLHHRARNRGEHHRRRLPRARQGRPRVRKSRDRTQPGRRDRRGRHRQAADDHDRSAPTAGRRTRMTSKRGITGRRALGHDHPRPPRPVPQGHGADVAAARPEGGHPRLRHRQDQRGVFTGRHQAHAAHGQAAHRPAHQPRREHRFQGLPASRERHRLRVRGHRPALLQRQPARWRAVRHHRRAAGLPAALRPECARLRALPPRGHRHRALGAPAGFPAPGQGRRSGSGS